ncbi:MAG: hypothetical protein PVI86_13365 [Phycisphaerae bacterium]
MGRDGNRPRLYGTLLYDRDRRRGFGGRCYPRGHYYHLYNPIHHVSYDYHWPWHGYRYSSLYYREPHVYQFYDQDVYYVQDSSSVADALIVDSSQPAPSPDSQPAPDATYQVLTEPNENTLIGRANAAFVAGHYEEARRYYVSAMLADERDGYAKFLYALVNFATGDYEVAGLAVRRALLTTPDLVDYPPDIRGLYPDEHVLRAQLGELARYAEKHPADHNVALLSAYLELTRGEIARALTIVHRLVESDENDDVAVLLRDGILRLQSGEQTPE